MCACVSVCNARSCFHACVRGYAGVCACVHVCARVCVNIDTY